MSTADEKAHTWFTVAARVHLSPPVIDSWMSQLAKTFLSLVQQHIWLQSVWRRDWKSLAICLNSLGTISINLRDSLWHRFVKSPGGMREVAQFHLEPSKIIRRPFSEFPFTSHKSDDDNEKATLELSIWALFLAFRTSWVNKWNILASHSLRLCKRQIHSSGSY